jgi:hypothetical protein
MLDLIRDHIRPFTTYDRFAAMRPGHRYPVCSLYLDSSDLLLYRQTATGEKTRFKIRVRTYSDDPATPAYFEVKRKIDRIVHKERAGLNRALAARVIAGESVAATLEAEVARDLEAYEHHAALIAARPILRVQYTREAYQATGHEPVRITVDTDLRYAITLDGDLSHTRGSWHSTPLEGAIIEVKFTERFPSWVQDLVRVFDMRQRSVPKYVLSVEHLLRERGDSAFDLFRGGR